MRKFTTIGMSTLAAASMAFGVAAGPASAVVVAPPTLSSAACDSLPAQLAAATTAFNTATDALATATAAVSSKEGLFTTSQSDFAAAVVSYVKAFDAKAPLGSKTALVYETLSAYSEKLAAWSSAVDAKAAAEKALTMSRATSTILNGIGGTPAAGGLPAVIGLACI